METYFVRAVEALSSFCCEIQELKHKPVLSEAAAS